MHRHDAAGNRTGIKTATHQYTLIYDAWHRLVEIKRATLDASGNPDPATQAGVARYEYNGLHQRTVKFTDHIAATTSNPAYFKTALHFYYNAAWQAVVEEQFSKLFATGSYNKSRYIQQFFGVRGINDVLFRREQTAGWQPTEYIPDIPGTSKTTSFYNSSYYQLTDAQGSVVGLIAAQQYGVIDTVNGIANFAFGQRFDELMYDPYGRAVRPVSTDADFNGDGGVTVQDIFDFLAAWFEGSATADVNADNAVTTQDIFDFLARWFAGGQGTIDRVSHPSVNNPYGYCGYYADAETVGMLGKHNGGLYHVRHRVYDPISGRFLQRDPAGFVDGMNLYEYVMSGPVGASDPMGLWAGVDDAIAAGVGAAIGVGIILIGDAISGQTSDWEDYAGAAAGGAAGGVSALYTGGLASGAVGGATANLVTQGLKNLSGKQSGISGRSLLQDTLVGAVLGKVATAIPSAAKAVGKKVHAIFGHTAAYQRAAEIGKKAANALKRAKDYLVKKIRAVYSNSGKAAGQAPKAAEPEATLPDGSFSIRDWSGYPDGVPKPDGPFRLLEGAEYQQAREAANTANRALRRPDPRAYTGTQIHEIQPVKFGGSPTNPANKIPLSPQAHSEVTNWWNTLMRKSRCE